jgi:hypothetical protein
MKTAIVHSKDLGQNCWLPARFCGGRCDRVMACTYPEKSTCKAVDAEIAYLQEQKQSTINNINKKIAVLRKKKGGDFDTKTKPN